jgi:apocytochrome f
MRRHLSLFLGSLVIGLALLIAPAASWAYPFWAQQNYDSPREATGKIVCANCHLAKKLTQAEVPQSVLPDSVFTASVKVPYEKRRADIPLMSGLRPNQAAQSHAQTTPQRPKIRPVPPPSK